MPLAVLALGAFLLVILHMVHPQRLIQERRPIEIVNSQNRRPLILIHQERKPTRLGRLLVLWQIDVHHFAVLREYGDNISFGESWIKSSDVDVRRVCALQKYSSTEISCMKRTAYLCIDRATTRSSQTLTPSRSNEQFLSQHYLIIRDNVERTSKSNALHDRLGCSFALRAATRIHNFSKQIL